MAALSIIDNCIAYCMGPKCGSRTVVGWAAIIRHPELYETHPNWFSASRPGDPTYYNIRRLVPMLKGRFLDSKIRFCVVRDPVERFVSAFTNRILFHKKGGENTTISELILKIDNPEYNTLYSDIIHHTSPLSHFYGTVPKKYTHIFNLREMDLVKRLLEDGSKIHLPDLHLQQSGNYKKPELTPTEVEWIKNRYKEDYRLFGRWF